MWYYLLVTKDSLLGKVLGKTFFRCGCPGPLLQRSPLKILNRDSLYMFGLGSYHHELRRSTRMVGSMLVAYKMFVLKLSQIYVVVEDARW